MLRVHVRTGDLAKMICDIRVEFEPVERNLKDGHRVVSSYVDVRCLITPVWGRRDLRQADLIDRCIVRFDIAYEEIPSLLEAPEPGELQEHDFIQCPLQKGHGSGFLS